MRTRSYICYDGGGEANEADLLLVLLLLLLLVLIVVASYSTELVGMVAAHCVERAAGNGKGRERRLLL